MNPLVEEIKSKYSEWLEMAGDHAPALLIEILGNLLLKEKSLTQYYKKLIEHKEKSNVRINSTNR
jgi:hypothetical protein